MTNLELALTITNVVLSPLATKYMYDKKDAILGRIGKMFTSPHIKDMQKAIEADLSTGFEVDTEKYPELGISYEEYELEHPESEAEYMQRLKFIHSKAWQEYQLYMEDRHCDEVLDMYVYESLLKYHSGKLSVTHDQYLMKFNNGLELWVANQYYNYGNPYTITDYKMPYRLNGDTGSHRRLSPYTFMWVVDSMYQRTNPISWKQKHDNYTRYKISAK